MLATLDRHVLLNRWQRDFPLLSQPFDALGTAAGCSGGDVIALLDEALRRGEASRVGAVFGVGAGGAGVLCAMRLPPSQLDAAAAAVSAEPFVNHNYGRDHAWNLWFVVTAPDREQAEACIARTEAATGTVAMRLPMRRAYRIDLGFDLYNGEGGESSLRADQPVPDALRPLAARLEHGLPLVARPFKALGEPLGLSEETVLRTLSRWCAQGTIRRFGVVLRHHEFGIRANAMTVFALPDDEVDAAGARLAAQPGVTLCYRRDSAPGWPYTLYCMVHGRERGAVEHAIAQAAEAAGLAGVPRQVLFSTRRFKQTGSRYFADSAADNAAAPRQAPACAPAEAEETA